MVCPQLTLSTVSFLFDGLSSGNPSLPPFRTHGSLTPFPSGVPPDTPQVLRHVHDVSDLERPPVRFLRGGYRGRGSPPRTGCRPSPHGDYRYLTPRKLTWVSCLTVSRRDSESNPLVKTRSEEPTFFLKINCILLSKVCELSPIP